MRFAITALVYLSGLVALLMGIGFLVDPVGSAAQLGVRPDGIAGISTIRADFTGLFGLTGLAMLFGAWRRNGDLLLVPALFYGTAFIIRAIDLAINGTYPMFAKPMAVEAFWSLLLFAAWKVLPHHRIDELTS
jgi:hypothetical protein